MIPVMIKPSIPPEPIAPKLADLLSPVIVITAEEAAYYAEICEDYSQYSAEEMLDRQPGLSQSAACDWAIYGQTVQGNLNLENIFILQATYAEQMRAHTKFLRDMIESMYQLSQTQQDAMRN